MNSKSLLEYEKQRGMVKLPEFAHGIRTSGNAAGYYRYHGKIALRPGPWRISHFGFEEYAIETKSGHVASLTIRPDGIISIEYHHSEQI